MSMLCVVLALVGIAPATHGAPDLAAAGAPEIRAQTDTPPALITLDRVSPSVLKPGQSLSVQGSVENVSDRVITMESVQVSSQNRALDTPGALDAWLAGDQTLSASKQVGQQDLSGRVAPGDTADFRVVIAANAISPPFSFASLPLLVDVITQDGAVLGSAHTILPWYDDEPALAPLELSWVVPLTLPPEPALTSAPGPERTDAWLQAVGQDSPARAWLDGLRRDNATFVVDPALLVPLASTADISAAAPTEQIPLPTPTDPSTTEPSASPTASPQDTQAPPAPTGSESTSGETDGQPPSIETGGEASSTDDAGDVTGLPESPTPIDEAEAEIQNRLGEVPAEQVWWLPVADPDLAALVDIDVDPQIASDVLNADLPPSVFDVDALVDRGRRDVGWPLWSQIDAAQLDGVRRMDSEEPLSTLVVPRSTFVDSSGVDRIPTGKQGTTTGPVDLLGYDERLSELVSTMPSAEADAEQIQAILGYSLARYQRSPAYPGAVVVAPERHTAIEAETVRDLSAALRSAPWIAQVPAATLLDEPTSAQGPNPSEAGESTLVTSTTLPSPAPSPLSLSEIDRIEGVRDTLGQLSGILPSAVAVQRWQPVLNGLYSTRWRSNPDGWSIPLAELESQIGIVTDGVKINPTDINFLAQEGLIQITIINDLPVAVKDLQLTLAPGNGRLRIIEQPVPITIGALSRANVQFKARAVAAGEVPVEATLSTPSGLLIGDAQEVDVQVRPTGVWIYWVLGGVGGAILILGLIRALRRPARNAGQVSA